MEKYYLNGLSSGPSWWRKGRQCRWLGLHVPLLAAAILLWAEVAPAQPRFDNEAPTDTTEPEPRPAEKKSKGTKKKKKNAVVSPAGKAEIKGRLVARTEMRAQRATIVNTSGNVENGLIKSLDFSIATARLSFHYESPMPWLTGVVEFELAGKPDLKDGYLQARFSRFRLRAGQFKSPVSPQESVAPFVLPTVHRGFVSHLLTDWLDVGGRRPGLLLTYHGKGSWRPSLTVAAFQASIATDILAGDRDTDRIKFKTLDAQSFVTRAQVEHGPVALGAWYEYRLGSPALNVAKRYSTAGADLTFDAGEQASGLRAWVSGVVGESWYRHSAIRVNGPEATFATGRLLAAYRLSGTRREQLYFEPFAFCGVFDPDLELSHDLLLETAVGMNVGLWRRARFTLQLESVVADTYFPKGSLGYLAGEEPRRESLFAQVALVF